MHPMTAPESLVRKRPRLAFSVGARYAWVEFLASHPDDSHIIFAQHSGTYPTLISPAVTVVFSVTTPLMRSLPYLLHPLFGNHQATLAFPIILLLFS
jgi:hypothetical protein